MYPKTRLRRIRRTELIRNMVRETNILPENLIMPYFVVSGRNKAYPVRSMPGIYRFSIDNLAKDIEGSGLKAVLLFGVKDESVVPNAVRTLRKEVPELVIFTDVCLCGYNRTGHCWSGDNDKTIKILSRMALSHAEAGADFVSPSAMMDGQVREIRYVLDKNGFTGTGIMAYSAKYASNFYWPFRDAMDSVPRFGDRKDYQMDYANAREALREVELDINEGADIVMVKPGLPYLDVIYRIKQRFDIPLAVFNVSGEYAMIKRAGKDAMPLVREVLTAIKRAGADIIITYHAKEFV